MLMCKKPSLLYRALEELEEGASGTFLKIYREQPLKIVTDSEAEDGAVNVPGGIHQDPTFGEAYYCVVAHAAQRSTKHSNPVGLCQYMNKLPHWFGKTVQEESGVLMVQGEVPPCNVANSCTNIHTYIHTGIHTYPHTYMHTYIHTYILTLLHTYIHTCIHAYIYT